MPLLKRFKQNLKDSPQNVLSPLPAGTISSGGNSVMVAGKQFSKQKLIIVATVFALAGAYLTFTSQAATTSSVNCGYGTFKSAPSPNAVFPSDCWRPYADSSPFNTPLPANPKIHPNSSNMISNLMVLAQKDHPQTPYRGIGNAETGEADTVNDFNHPTY